jgi:hypothetical protein
MAGPFYVNSHRDVLWLSMDLTDEPECLQDLMLYHKRELNTFTTVLVEEHEWAENTGRCYKFSAGSGGGDCVGFCSYAVVVLG